MNLVRLTVSLATLAFAAACASAPKPTPVEAPTLTSQELEVVDQGLTDFLVRLDAQVSSAQPLTLDKARYELVVEGKVVKSGEAALNVAVPAGETQPFSVEAPRSQYVSSPEELKTMSNRGGAILAALRGTVLASTADGQTVEIPFARSRDVRVPRLPTVKLHQVDGARYSDEEVNTVFSLGVMNPNPFKIGISELSYVVTMAGKELAKGTLARGESVDAAATGIFEVSTSFTPATYGPDAKKVIKSLTIPWTVTGELEGDLVKEPFALDGELRLNVSR